MLLFDVTGRQVAKLFSGRIDTQQTIAVNAEQFSSGVYFAQLRSGESALAATKLLLLK
ncbi:MAG: T9SS type A sorting domain-containing protein [bacterium]|nr:T9SS type A sorting domain-containing protein [bacterium]